LKNSFRKWFFKETWFERFFVEPEESHEEPFVEGYSRHLYRLFEELFKEMVL